MSKRDEQLNLRMREDEKTDIRRMAADLNMSVSDFVRNGSKAYYNHRKAQAMQRANANRPRSEQDPQQ